MLEQMRSLAKEHRWSEVLEIAPIALASTNGEDTAKVHLHVASAYAGLGNWKSAFSHTEQALTISESGSYTHTWALQKMSSLCVDTGKMKQAFVCANDYLKSAPNYPSLVCLTPFVVRDISHVLYRQGRFTEAVIWRHKAVALFVEQGNWDEVARTEINLAWAYARAGQTRKAHAYLPPTVPWYMDYLLWSAKAIIAAKEKRWEDAKKFGLLALHGMRLAHDYVDAAETALIVSQAQSALGNIGDVIAYIRLAAVFSSRQEQSAYALMVLNLRERGGDMRDEATCFCGDTGFNPAACFTTGIG